MRDAERPKRSRPGLFVQVMRRRYRDPAEDWDPTGGELDANPAAGWVYGVIVAGAIAAYGVVCLFGDHAYFPTLRRGGGWINRFDGPAAFWVGCIYLGLALTLHFHSFWGTQPKLSRYHEPAWFAALTATCIATVFFLWRSVG